MISIRHKLLLTGRNSFTSKYCKYNIYKYTELSIYSESSSYLGKRVYTVHRSFHNYSKDLISLIVFGLLKNRTVVTLDKARTCPPGQISGFKPRVASLTELSVTNGLKLFYLQICQRERCLKFVSEVTEQNFSVKNLYREKNFFVFLPQETNKKNSKDL